MKPLLWGVFLLMLLMLFSFCTKEMSPTVIKHEKWTFKTQTLDLEIALSEAEQKKGLMFHVPLKGNEGMLFIYNKAQEQSYWNPNVPFDIDLAFFDAGANIMSIHRLLADDETSVNSFGPAQYVLEMRKGWFKEKGFNPGDKWEELLQRGPRYVK